MGQLFDKITAGLPPNPNRGANWMAIGSGLSQLGAGQPVDLSQHYQRIQENKGMAGAIEALKGELGPEKYKALLGAPPAVQKAIITQWYQSKFKEPEKPNYQFIPSLGRAIDMNNPPQELLDGVGAPKEKGPANWEEYIRTLAPGEEPTGEGFAKFLDRNQKSDTSSGAYANMSGQDAVAQGLIDPQHAQWWDTAGPEQRAKLLEQSGPLAKEPTPPPTTIDMKNFEASVNDGSFDASKGLAGFMEWEHSLRKPTVVINPGDAIQGELSKVVAERVGESWAKAEDARALVGVMDSTRPLIDKMITGIGAPTRVQALRFFELIGVNIDPETMAQADASQAYGAVMGRAVAMVIKDFGAGTGLSDADREYAAKITAGTIELDAEAIKTIFSMADKAARGKIFDHNDLVGRVSAGDISTIMKVTNPSVAQSDLPSGSQEIYDPQTGTTRRGIFLPDGSIQWE